MRRLPTKILTALVLLGAASTPLAAAPGDEPAAVALRAANPRLLSGGIYSALAANGAFGGVTLAARARAGGVPDLSKGKPPAVLDARVGVNVRLGDDPAALPNTQRAQAEPHLARSAANPDVLLATFQEGRFAEDGGSVDCGYALSKDNGLSWTRSLIPQLTTASGGSYRRATDPVAAAGPQGDLYLSTLVSIDNAFGSADLVVSRSTDGGATWLAPSIAFHQTTPLAAPDKDWLAVNDFAGTPNSGRLVATWTNFTATAAGASTGDNLLAAVSDDRGATWSAPITITPTGSFNQGTQSLFLPDGSLAVVYITFTNPNNEALFSIQCKRSTDGGRTFPAAATTAVVVVNGYEDPDLRSGVFLPNATVARTTGEIFVTYVAIVAGVPRVMITKSSDQGATWTAPVIASDNPSGAGVINPAVAATADGKTVTLSFIDKRNSPVATDGHSYFVDLYGALSFDGGATWLPNLRLSDLPGDVRNAPLTEEGYMLGDYLGLAASLPRDSRGVIRPCVAVWCDTRSGDADPYIVRFQPSQVGSFQEWCDARGLFSVEAISDVEDGDGVVNYQEFFDGTDPRHAESGESLVVHRSSPDTVDIAWTARAPAIGSFGSPGVFVLSDPNLRSIPPFPNAAPPPVVPLSADQLPNVPPPTGLAWQGVRANVPAGTAREFVRGFKITNGQTVPTTSEPPATIDTDSRLINLSTRGPIDQANSPLVPMIAGFVTRGGPRSLLLRGVGPSLATFGVTNVAGDPSLALLQIGTATTATVTLAQNDNWQSGGTATTNLISTAMTRAGAFPLTDPRDAALLTGPLEPANYSVQLLSPASAGGSTGLAEIYDVSPASDGLLVNLSTLGRVGLPDQALIAGFVIGGTQPRRVLLRAVGPSLTQFTTLNSLVDPVLTLYDSSGRIVAVNDDWEISRSSAAIAATAQNVGAFALNPASLDAALLITLAPGAYTAVVTGANGATGTALVEVYDAN